MAKLHDCTNPKQGINVDSDQFTSQTKIQFTQPVYPHHYNCSAPASTLSYNIQNTKQSLYVLYSMYTRYSLLFKYDVLYLCAEQCVVPSNTYSPLPYYRFLVIYLFIHGPGSSVGIATGYGLDGREIKSTGTTVRN
jgi:hypothetical protein